MLFSKNIYDPIGNIKTVELGGGYSTKFKYCSREKKIYGLQRFIRKYDIDEDYILFFKYTGDSTFALTVLDYQCMNHFRDIKGYFHFEDFLYPPIDMEIVNISDDENNAEGT